MRKSLSGMFAFCSVMLAAHAIAGDISPWWLLLAGLVFGLAWGARDV